MQNKELIIDNLIDIWQEKKIEKALPAEGKSMYPLIKQGDSISIKFTRPENIKVGDIVAFKRDNITIVHRLIKKTGNGFIEKGDFQIRGNFIEAKVIFGKVQMQNNVINYFMSILGYIIHMLSYTGKPFLIIPFIINAGTRIYIKLRKD